MIGTGATTSYAETKSNRTLRQRHGPLDRALVACGYQIANGLYSVGTTNLVDYAFDRTYELIRRRICGELAHLYDPKCCMYMS